MYLLEVTSHFHNATCAFLLICYKNHPDDDGKESKHVAVWMFYKVVFDVYCLLLILYFWKTRIGFLREMK